MEKVEIKAGKNDFTHKAGKLAHLLKRESVISADIFIDTKSPPDLSKIKPILYHLINAYERKTSLIFHDIPYCILPDAEEHVINQESEEKRKLDACDNCRFERFCGGFPKGGGNIRATPVRDLPREVSIELTTRCDLDCDFCFNKMSYDRDRSLDRDKVLSVLGQAAKLGAQRVRFTGGEPLLDENFPVYANHARELGLGVWLNSNGYDPSRYSPKIIKSIDSLLIPVHGTGAEPGITGMRDSLRKKAKTINRIMRSGGSGSGQPSLRIGTVVLSRNIDEIGDVHDLVKSWGARWELYRLISGGAGSNPGDFLRLHDAMLRIYNADARRFFVANALPFCIFENPENARLFSIGGLLDDGRDRVVVDAKGDAKPTYYSKARTGSWRNLAGAWQSSDARKLRNLGYLPKGCRECCYRTICKGGSRTLAKNVHGSYSANDPLLGKSCGK